MVEASVSTGKVTLFSQDLKSRSTYRVPALLYIPTDTLLAFAEKRSSTRDEDAEYLVLRRGRKTGASIEWEPAEPLKSAVLKGYRTMNPCPVYEWKSQTVFLFFICVRQHVSEQWQIYTGRNAARLCYICSRDSGQTWSSLIDLTKKVLEDDLKDWATFAVGPGHGVQLSSGRLVIPAYAYHITARCCSFPLPCYTQPRSLVFYSDNEGQDWHKGELMKRMKTVECEVAEIVCQACDPVLYCSARTPHRCRAVALSTDQGLTFETPSACNQLYEPPHGCQGSVVSFIPTLELLKVDESEESAASDQEKSSLMNHGNDTSATHTSAVSWLLYSHPTDKHKRVNLGIYLNCSPLEEDKWKAPWILYKGPCGYSDLAVCQEAPLLFGCLFECGMAHGCEEIAFQLFTAEELQKGRGSPYSLEQQPKAKLKVI
uniref:exo-alpha-sialidase n=1 Tax=Pelodiscus sinensis TaxID=13735 RepID=K7FQ08_PELSI|nr:sialidase-3 [Pelodiscus sinensis]|eukprot:XP_006127579.1 sialidase-3 [Pelodiscus sinensis]